MQMRLRAMPFFTFLVLYSVSKLAWADDCWLSVQGSGLKNGSDALNSYSAKNAQKCWDQTGAADVMHVAEGRYTVQDKTFWKLDIAKANDGSASPETSKGLIGQGQVIIEGSRQIPYQINTKDTGESWIRILRGASNLSIQNFNVARIKEGIAAKEGGNHTIEIKNIHFSDTRQNILIAGHPQCIRLSQCRFQPEEISHNIVIDQTSGLRYSKRHIRLTNGVWGVQVSNSHADGAFLDGDFAVGFDVENPSHDIQFSHCTSRGNRYSLSEYWNGDGFKTENETRNIRWDHCAAFDNADGGFDIKSDNAVLENIIALRNNRNIRSWSPEKIILRNVNASYSKHWGGIGTEAGIWTEGTLDCHFCTLHNNKIQIHAENNTETARVRIFDSILSMDASVEGETIRQEKESSVDLIRTQIWQQSEDQIDPKFAEAELSSWEGGNENFNSRTYGKTKGYYYD